MCAWRGIRVRLIPPFPPNAGLRTGNSHLPKHSGAHTRALNENVAAEDVWTSLNPHMSVRLLAKKSRHGYDWYIYVHMKWARTGNRSFVDMRPNLDRNHTIRRYCSHKLP